MDSRVQKEQKKKQSFQSKSYFGTHWDLKVSRLRNKVNSKKHVDLKKQFKLSKKWENFKQ